MNNINIYNEEDKFFMMQALKESEKALKKEEVPVGVVIVKDGIVIARAYNKREQLKDATAHAEIIAIKKVCKKLKNWRLSGCTMYVTLEPCLMCYGAIINARIDRLIYGAENKNNNIDLSKIKNMESVMNHKLSVCGGVLASEAEMLIKKLFKR